MNAQIIRIYEILATIKHYPHEKTIPQIINSLEQSQIYVSERTIQRDMQMLSEKFLKSLGHTKHSDRRVGWFWKENAAVINLPGLTINQALSFSLIKKYLTPLFPSVTVNALEPFFDQAETTLEGLNENPLFKWPNKIAVVEATQPLLPPAINSDIHKSVTEALLGDFQLIISYEPVNRAVQDYHINPLGLFLRNQVSYLVASKVDTEGLRTFALHRMSEVKITDKKVVYPDDFDFQTYINDNHILPNLSGNKSFESIQLKFLADNWVTRHLSESRLSEDQSIKRIDDESSEIFATVQETEQLFWWLLGFGARVEVLEPFELRMKMADSVKVLAEKYAIVD